MVKGWSYWRAQKLGRRLGQLHRVGLSEGEAAADPKQEDIMACSHSKPLEKTPSESRKLRKSKKNRQSDHDRLSQSPAAVGGGGIVSNLDEALRADYSQSAAESSEPMKTKKSRNKHHDSPGGGGEDTLTLADNGRLGELESRDLTCAMDAEQCKQQQCLDDRGASAHAADGVVAEIVDRFEAKLPSFTNAKKSEKNHSSGSGERSVPADALVIELGDDQDVDACSRLPSETPDLLKAKTPKKSGSSSYIREHAHDGSTDCQSSAAADEIMEDVIDMSKSFDTSSLMKAKKLKKLKKKPSSLSPQADGKKDYYAAAPDVGVLSRTLDFPLSAMKSKTPKKKRSKSSIAGLVQFGEDAQQSNSSAADGTLVPCSQTSSLRSSGPAKPKKPKKHRPSTRGGESRHAFDGVIIELEDNVVLESPVPLSSRTSEKEECRSSSAMKHGQDKNSSLPSAAGIGSNFDGAAAVACGGISKASDSSCPSQFKKPKRKCRHDGRGGENVDEGNVLAVAGHGTEPHKVAGGNFSSFYTKPKTSKGSRSPCNDGANLHATNDIVVSDGIVIDLDDYAFDNISIPLKLAKILRKRRKHEDDGNDGHADTISVELEDATHSRSPHAAACLNSSGSRSLSKKERKKLKKIGSLDAQAGQIVPLGSRDLIHVREDGTGDTKLLEAEENGAREIRSLTSRKKLKGSKRRQRSSDERGRDRGHESDFRVDDSPLFCNLSVQKKIKEKKQVRFLLPEGEVVAPEDEDTRKRSWRYDHNTPDLHFGKFTPKEDEAIKTAVDGYIEERGWDKVQGLEMLLNSGCYKEARGAWLSIANCLPHRPVKLINSRARRLLEGGKRGKWLEVESQHLRTLFLEHGPDWKKIGITLDRPAQVCKDKWRSLNLAPVKTGPWTQDERDQLQSNVLLNLESKQKLAEHDEVDRSRWRRNEINWEQIGDKMNRRGGACAEVWYKKISPFLFEGDVVSEHDTVHHLKSALKKTRSASG